MTTPETCGLIGRCHRWAWLSIPLILAIMINEARAMESHGAGPNGGSIQMPGAFHTEVVSDKNGFMVYLLDRDLKNPVTKDSKVLARLVTEGKTEKLNCQSHGNHFYCPTSSSKAGQLEIEAVRDGKNIVLRSEKLSRKKGGFFGNNPYSLEEPPLPLTDLKKEKGSHGYWCAV